MPFLFKVVHPYNPEIYLVDLKYHFNDEDYEEFKQKIRGQYEIKDDQEFYLTMKDKYGDQITMKSCFALHYMMYFCKTYGPDLRVTIVLEGESNTSTNNGNSAELVSEGEKLREDTIELLASLQNSMKKLEQRMDLLQASVEKSPQSTVDSVIKTAAETAANVYRLMFPPPSISSENHQFDVICDGCYSPIKGGQRWRCETCDDFDFCSACKSRVNNNHHQQHHFRLVKNKSNQCVQLHSQQQKQLQVETVSESSPPPMSKEFICNYCNSDIVGICHSCKTCSDFDLCDSCLAKVEGNHPIKHDFITRLLIGTTPQANKSQSNKKSKPISSQPASPQQSQEKLLVILHHDIKCSHFQIGSADRVHKCEHCADDKSHATINPFELVTKKNESPQLIPPKTINKRTAEESSKKAEIIHTASTSSESNKKILHPQKTNAATASVLPVVRSPSVQTDTYSVQSSDEELEKEDEVLSAAFVSDLNIPDGTLVAPNKTFVKMWKVVNNGNVDWPAGTSLMFNGGSILRPNNCETYEIVPVISPNEAALISAELKAPAIPGEYSSYFCLGTPDGTKFGDSLWCTVKVASKTIKSSTNTAAANILMNSSNSMIFPTTTLSVDVDDHPSSPSIGEFTDRDDYSEFTQDHHSIITFETAHHTSYSHASTPSSYELDIEEDQNSRELFFTSKEEDEEKDESNIQKFVINPSHGGIPPSKELQPLFKSMNNNAARKEKNKKKEDFVIVGDQQKRDIGGSMTESNNGESSLSSSAQTITTNKSDKRQMFFPDNFKYRSELLQLHEMGFTSNDSLLSYLLYLNSGNINKVVLKLLMHP